MFAMSASLPHTVNHGNNFFPYTVRSAAYIEQMGNADQKSVLWTNIAALMRHHYGKENINQLHKESKVSLATFTRIKQQGTSVGIDIVGQVAAAFGLEAWQLLVPDLDPESVPTLEGESESWPFEAPLHARLMALSLKSRHMVEAWLHRNIEEREAIEGNRKTG